MYENILNIDCFKQLTDDSNLNALYFLFLIPVIRFEN